MGFWATIPIIDRITKWIDEWRANADLRRQKAITKIKVELAEVNGELKAINDMDLSKFHDYSERYSHLFKRRRLLEQQLQSMAR